MENQLFDELKSTKNAPKSLKTVAFKFLILKSLKWCLRVSVEAVIIYLLIKP